ncbi:MAG TPA: VWA domain-containing protein [Coleofasciculaceae cyanobacterium]
MKWLRKRQFWSISFSFGLCLTVLAACFGGGISEAKNLDEAVQILGSQVMPKISVQDEFVSDAAAARYSIAGIADPLPDINDFPIFAAKPTGNNEIYLEIFGSTEKSNAERTDSRWLVDVAEAFNQKNIAIGSKPVRVGVRRIDSGAGMRFLAAGQVKPAAYSPSNNLWLSLLSEAGVKFEPVADRLLPNSIGFVLRGEVYQQIAATGPVTFDSILNAIAAGKLTIGYPNPYRSSTALNLMYALFWRAAGRDRTGGPLTEQDVQSPQVASVFEQFQKQVLIATNTSPELQDIFLRDKSSLQAFPLEYQNYQTIQKMPGFEQTKFVPLGLPHTNPLVSLPWTTTEQKAALKVFAEFARSPEMQQLATSAGFVESDYVKAGQFPPLSPSGKVLKAIQAQWKRGKDVGKTVYLMTVIDTSGSMDGEPLKAVQSGLKAASTEINSGNQVGLVTFSDTVVRRLTLAPFDQLQHQKFLAAIETLRADGGTAMYNGLMVALNDLLAKKKADPNGRFYAIVLSDGDSNTGFRLDEVKSIIAQSGIRVYPIAYGDVDKAQLESIAALRESSVQSGDPKTVRDLLKGLFETNL